MRDHWRDEEVVPTLKEPIVSHLTSTTGAEIKILIRTVGGNQVILYIVRSRERGPTTVTRRSPTTDIISAASIERAREQVVTRVEDGLGRDLPIEHPTATGTAKEVQIPIVNVGLTESSIQGPDTVDLNLPGLHLGLVLSTTSLHAKIIHPLRETSTSLRVGAVDLDHLLSKTTEAETSARDIVL
ncbi:MAG: hypothetical protein L6R40_003758 [Gallowayella cf. fulva]|nr:MAG: hypothetical protein L6R40_003758 [Xanthomendoza cf. fulva]